MSFLGKGGLSTVLALSENYAVKILSDIQAAEEESAILERLGRASTVVGFYGRLDACGPGQAALLLELCQSSLADLLSTLDAQRLPSASGLSSQQYVVMMLNCLAQLHGRGVIHQDIKPSNFLFGTDGTIKLCDFNLSRVATDTTRTTGGTLLYSSPQKFCEVDDGYAADWWAFGVTLYQLLQGLQSWPFISRSLRSIGKLPAAAQFQLVRTAVMKGNMVFRTLSGLPRAARTLIRGLLHPKPDRRWSLLHVLAGDYPGDKAFSAVALRHPHLAPDMERLLAVRRLCRGGATPERPVGEGPEDVEGGVPRCGVRQQPDDRPRSASAGGFGGGFSISSGVGGVDGGGSGGTRTRRSLRALRSCLLSSRKRPYSCGGGCAPPALTPPPERDDLYRAADQQLSVPQGAAAVLPSAPSAALGSMALSSAVFQSPVMSWQMRDLRDPGGDGDGGGGGGGAGGVDYGGSGGGDGGCRHVVSRATTAPPGAESPAPARFHPPQRVDIAATLDWTTSGTVGACLAGAFPRACALRRALLPRSDAAARAAAARAAGASRPDLLTADGRLTAPPFVPCEVRTHLVDLSAVRRALVASNAATTAAAAGCLDSGPQVAAACGGAAGTCGQVQGLEVLEEMRLMLERRRLSSRAATGTGDSGGADGVPTGTAACYPSRPHSQTHPQEQLELQSQLQPQADDVQRTAAAAPGSGESVAAATRSRTTSPGMSVQGSDRVVVGAVAVTRSRSFGGPGGSSSSAVSSRRMSGTSATAGGRSAAASAGMLLLCAAREAATGARSPPVAAGAAPLSSSRALAGQPGSCGRGIGTADRGTEGCSYGCGDPGPSRTKMQAGGERAAAEATAGKAALRACCPAPALAGGKRESSATATHSSCHAAERMLGYGTEMKAVTAVEGGLVQQWGKVRRNRPGVAPPPVCQMSGAAHLLGEEPGSGKAPLASGRRSRERTADASGRRGCANGGDAKDGGAVGSSGGSDGCGGCGGGGGEGAAAAAVVETTATATAITPSCGRALEASRRPPPQLRLLYGGSPPVTVTDSHTDTAELATHKHTAVRRGGGGGGGGSGGGVASTLVATVSGCRNGCGDVNSGDGDTRDGDSQALPDDAGSLFSLPMSPCGPAVSANTNGRLHTAAPTDGDGGWGSAEVVVPELASTSTITSPAVQGAVRVQEESGAGADSRGRELGQWHSNGHGQTCAQGHGHGHGHDPSLSVEDERWTWGSGGADPWDRGAATADGPERRRQTGERTTDAGGRLAVGIVGADRGSKHRPPEEAPAAATAREAGAVSSFSPRCGGLRSAPGRFSGNLGWRAGGGGAAAAANPPPVQTRSSRETASAAPGALLPGMLAGAHPGVDSSSSGGGGGGWKVAPPSSDDVAATRSAGGTQLAAAAASGGRSWSLRGRSLIRAVRQAGA